MILARLRPGVAGETRREVHLFPQDSCTALCGATFPTSDLERLDGFHGMPCVRCLARAPGGRGLAIR
nr:hypothetical protein [Amycolatopsis methanolica]